MKKVVFLFFLIGISFYVPAQIWSEDFNSYAPGTFNAPPKWTTNATDCDDGGALNLGAGASQWGVYGGQFTVNDIEGSPCCGGFGPAGGGQNDWTTEVIDISNHCNITISIDINGTGNFECDSPGVPIFGCQGSTPPDNSHDQVVAEYNLDGSGYTQLAYVCGGTGFGSFSSPPLNGATLQIRVWAANKANGEFYNFDNVIVNGMTPPTPMFNPIGPVCENDPPIPLQLVSNNGITGTWDVGPTFNPAGQGGNTVTINFTPTPGQCALPTSMMITVQQAANISLPNLGPFCDTDPPTVLNIIQGGFTGNWSGIGVNANLFNPAGLGGNYTLTFTPNPGQCANPSNTVVTVNASVTPTLGMEVLCQSDPPFDLTTLQDPMYPSGIWQGPGVMGNLFDPSGLSGTIQISFISSDACVLPATTEITVNIPVDPNLTSDEICDDSGIYDLNQLEDPLYPNGTWSGTGVSGDDFDPTGQSGTVVLTFTPSDNCVNIAPTTITVNMASTPNLGLDTLCENNGLFDLTTLEDPNHTGGVWSGIGVTGTDFDPTGLNGTINLTYDQNESCVQTAMTTIEVLLVQTPSLGSDEICEDNGIYDLQQLLDPNFPNGIWLGNGVNGNNFDPTGLNGAIQLTFTPDFDCTENGITEITVNTLSTPTLGTDTICVNNGLYDLTLLLDPGFPSGTWSGSGVNGNFFDPISNTGSVQLIFSSDEDCVNLAMTTIEVGIPDAPTLGAAEICENNGLFDLTQLLDPTYVSGTWSGPGVSANDFDPFGLAPGVQLIFTSDQECVDTASTFITINPSENPMLSTDDICEGNDLYNLNLLLDPNYPTGTWSGQGVSGNDFDPTGLLGTITLMFDSDEDCVNTDSTTIEINPILSPILGTASICEENGIFDLSALEDPSFPSGNWAGQGVSGNSFDPSGLNGNISVTYTPDGNCEDLSTTTITVNSAPTFTNLLLNCDPGNQFYTVGFEITGGDSTSYQVDGNAVIGSAFLSSQINNGDTYNFMLDDGNSCGPIIITGSFDCNCVTNSGTMNFSNAPLEICDGNSFEVIHNENENLDGDDLFLYILHDQAGTQLGNIISISDTTFFDFPTGIIFGQTYYISAVAGSNDGDDMIDLTDACLSVAPGIPVSFYQLDVAFSSGVELCEGECHDFDINFTGNPPFELIYMINTPLGIFSDTLVSDTNFITQTICPSDYGITDGEILVSPTALNDINCNNFSQNTSIQTLTIHEFPVTDLNPTLCPGEVLLVNGVFYDENNLTGTEIISNGSQYNCDSIVNVSLTYHQDSETMIDNALCEGASLIINGNVYDENTPNGTEIISAGSSNGCDSTIYIALTFIQNSVNNLFQTICQNDFVTVNGNIYDQSIPSGTEIIPNGALSGCDSIININLGFFSPAEETVDETICENESLVINGNVYDINTPVGTELIPNASINGCDSTVLVNLSFSPIPVENFSPSICEGESVNVNGVIYDENTPTGIEIIQGGSMFGCDSIVQISLNFIPHSEFNLSSTICEGSSIVLNGNIYDENTPSGVEIIENGSLLGCDSIIHVNLEFASEVTFDINETLCPEGSIEVNGTVYDQNNSTGSETFENGSALGCDSVVNINLSFHTSAENFLIDTLCEGSTVVVNGNIYNQSVPTGTEILVGASFNGCDSTVFINLSFNPLSSFDLTQTICTDETIVVNGTTYGFNNSSGVEVIPNGNYLGCDSTINVALNFYAPAIENLVPELCDDESIVINGTTYDFNTPSGTEIIPDASINGCDSTINVNLIFIPEAVGNLNLTLCEDESVVINGNTYNINSPSGIELFPDGSFQGCDSTLNVNLTFMSDVVFNLMDTLPIGQSITVNGNIYDENNPTGTETFVNGAFNGCDSVVNINLEFFEEISISINQTPPSCFGDNDANIIIDTIFGGSSNVYFVNLEGQPPIPYNSFPIVLSDLSGGNYVVHINDGQGQELMVEIDIPQPTQIIVELGDDQIINLGESTILAPQTNITPDSILWSPSDYLDCDNCYPVTANPPSEVTYTLTVYDSNGCPESDQVTIFVQKVRNVFVPNAFSPNGDAVNDQLTIFAGPNVLKINSFQIFSRWGELLFEQTDFDPNDVNLGWDGNFNGEKMNTGVYVYFAEVEFLDGEIAIFKGDVILMR